MPLAKMSSRSSSAMRTACRFARRSQEDVRDAERALRKTHVKRDEGESVAAMRLTFDQAADSWLASLDAGDLRPTTAAAYRGHVETHLRPTFGGKPVKRLDRITTKDVRALVARMRTVEYRTEVNAEMGKKTKVTEGYKAWTIRGALVALGLIFDHARDTEGWRGANPVRELRRKDRPKVEESERRILSRKELDDVISAATERYGPVIATAGLLGTRLGETFRLLWKDIDLDVGTVSVTIQIDRSGQRVPLKTTRSRRVIEAPGALVSMLRAHKLASPNVKPDALVFVTRDGKPMDHRSVTKQGLEAACKRAQIAQPYPTFHGLRHAHASAWIANGGDLVELSKRLGHADPSITASVYAHDFEAAARSDQRRARLDSIYGFLGFDVAAEVAATEVNEGQETAIQESDNLVDLQAKRSAGQ